MAFRTLLRPLSLTVATVALCGSVAAQNLRETARQLIEEKGDAVITVDVVVDIKTGGDPSEQRNEIQALVVAEDGTAITALSNIDPSGLYERLMGTRESAYSVTVKDMRYILPDGTEIPATILLRDPDLDVVVLRPKEAPAEPMTFIEMAKPSQEPGILDEAFTVVRTGRITRRAIAASTGEITGIIERPRLFYLPSASLSTGDEVTGRPVFNAAGETLGLTLLQIQAGAFNDPNAGTPVINVIRPADQLLKALEQAKTAEPEEITGETDEEATEEETPVESSDLENEMDASTSDQPVNGETTE